MITKKQNEKCAVKRWFKAYSEHCQTSKMERFENIIEGFEPLTVFAKRSILDVWQGSEYASTADAYFGLGKKLIK